MGIKEAVNDASKFITNLLKPTHNEKSERLLEEIYGSKELADLHGYFSETQIEMMGGEAHVLKTLEARRLANQSINPEQSEDTTIFQNLTEESKDR